MVKAKVLNFNGAVVAQREGSAVTYLHGDHLGSVSVLTDAAANLAPNSKQKFDPWGKVRAGGASGTTLNYTGQRLDATGLLYYNARYYDPNLGRFISADTVVPGNASGGMDGVALRPLTVAFHETSLLKGVNGEGANADKLYWGGPLNPQSLNRYSYVGNNPMRWTDPSGHSVYMSHAEAHSYAKTMREVGGYLKMQFFGGVALSGIARKQALNAVLNLIAQRAAQGAITTVLGTALMSLVGIAIVPGVLADAALIGGRLEQFANLIEEQNGSDGVILASECGLLICDVTILDRHTGNGSLWSAPSIIFGMLLGDEQYRPGRAFDNSGHLLSKGLWERDNSPIYLPLAGS